MRAFSLFGLLGLFHIARGGELDEFAAYRAEQARASKLGSSRPAADLPASRTPQADGVPIELFNDHSKRHVLASRVHHASDKDKDGSVTFDEFMSSMLFAWSTKEKVDEALAAFHLPSPEQIFAALDEDGNGHFLPGGTLANTPCKVTA